MNGYECTVMLALVAVAAFAIHRATADKVCGCGPYEEDEDDSPENSNLPVGIGNSPQAASERDVSSRTQS